MVRSGRVPPLFQGGSYEEAVMHRPVPSTASSPSSHSRSHHGSFNHMPENAAHYHATTKKHDRNMPRNVRYSDQRLVQMAEDACSSINWEELTGHHRLNADWVRKKNDGKLEIYTRNRKRWDSTRTSSLETYGLLARRELPCSIQEIRLVFRTPTTEAYRTLKQALLPKDFIDGEILHIVDMSTLRSSNNRPVFRSNNVGQYADVYIPELYVKAITFDKPTLFRSREHWVGIDFIQPVVAVNQSTNGRNTPEKHDSSSSRPAFTRTLVVLSPEDCFVDQTTTGAKHGHDSVLSYYFEQSPTNPKTTRVVFFSEHVSPTIQSSWKRAKWKARTSTIQARFIRMAEMMNRLMRVVHRRRLGLQVVTNPLACQPVNPNCFVCARTFMQTRPHQCMICGYAVCDKCSQLHEREYYASRASSTPRIHDVRVCDRCIQRVAQCDYSGATYENLMPAAIIEDAAKPSGSATATGHAMVTVLREALVNGSERDKAAAQKLIKLLVGSDYEDDDELEIASGSSRSTGSLTCSNQDCMDALEAYVHATDTPFPLEECIVANNRKRNYPLPFPEDPAQPITFGPTPNEHERVAAIKRMGLRSLRPVAELDLICLIASRALHCLGGIVAILHKDTYHIIACNLNRMANLWLEMEEGICTQMLRTPHPLIISHARADVRCSKVKWVARTGVNFYCGFPFKSEEDDTTIGSVCCVDEMTHTLTLSQYGLMIELAQVAAKVIQRESKAITQKTVKKDAGITA